MENFAEYYYISNSLNTVVALETVWPFVLKHCNTFFEASYFLELSMADVLKIIKCQDLEAKSEDEVINAILKWVEFQPEYLCVTGNGLGNSDEWEQNKQMEACCGEELSRKSKDFNEIHDKDISTVDKIVAAQSHDKGGDAAEKNNRKKHLTILLSHARTCLASQQCLEMLANHPLTRNNTEAKDIVIDALLYQLQVGKRNGQWPSRAIHRNISDFIHCLVDVRQIGNDAVFRAYSLTTKEWLKLTGFINVGSIKIAAVDNVMYAITTDMVSIELAYFQVQKGTWTNNNKVNLSLKLKSDNFFVAVIDSFVYIFSAQDQKVWKLDTTSQNVTQISILTEQEAISYVMPFDQNILVFYASIVKGEDETVIQSYDTSQNSWTKLNNLEGPVKGMTSFKDDHFTYLLQSNGDLWKVVKQQSNIIDFEFVVKLWSCEWPLYGAITFMNELYIHGAKSDDLHDDPNLLRSLPGVFSKINYIESTFIEKSMSLPLTLERKYLV